MPCEFAESVGPPPRNPGHRRVRQFLATICWQLSDRNSLVTAHFQEAIQMSDFVWQASEKLRVMTEAQPN